ncbi:putative ABC transporter solute-binding protein YclQ precursor [Pseudovibrio sp. Ad46]|uniref:siderophore ABC transporter substrate-binding protein n=1 Tax=Pseudovibrio sp. Ad46 TaxID=989432 RepID=UPI0007AEDADF|nr:siderophore ABC transporter substrate-binding protein [Pseudovibrio sp. Ad46]KZK85806.1 putative ABC transporter solute-binding protein YclQ precursor [Pseudovibrio sp. Ad46]
MFHRVTRSVAAFACLALAASPALSDQVEINTANGKASVVVEPKNLIVFDIGAVDNLNALGVQPAGVVNKMYVDYLDGVQSEADVIGTLFEPDFEAINALEPELIIVGGRSSKQAKPLSELAPTIDMTPSSSEVSATLLAHLEAYGKIFNKQKEAAQLTSNYNRLLEQVKASVKDKGKALFVLTNGPKVSVFGPGSRFGWFHDELKIEPAMAEVAVASHGEAVSFEYIQKANPDWLLVMDRATAIGSDAENARQVLDNELVASTTAWKKGQVIYLDPAATYIAQGGYQATMRTFNQLIEAFNK